MAELKTRKSAARVDNFLQQVRDPKQREDCYALVGVMRKITGAEPAMWGPSIVGFGSYHYKYNSGREGDWFLTGFSPRKQSLSVYIMSGFGEFESLMKSLGKHKTGKSCLYIKRLEDVDLFVLTKLIQKSVARLAKGRP